MTGETDDSRDISRRGVFKQVGAVGVAAIAGTPLAAAAAATVNA